MGLNGKGPAHGQAGPGQGRTEPVSECVFYSCIVTVIKMPWVQHRLGSIQALLGPAFLGTHFSILGPILAFFLLGGVLILSAELDPMQA